MDEYIDDIKMVLKRYNCSYITIDNSLSIKKIYLLLVNNVSYEPSNVTEMIYLGWYYQDIQDYAKMKKYYLMAIDKGNSTAMYNLGLYFQTIENNYLGVYYQEIEKEYDQMKKYYKQK